MPIYIEQKFKRCDLCGKTIPLKKKPLTLELSNKKLSFCSSNCKNYYEETRLHKKRTKTVKKLS